MKKDIRILLKTALITAPLLAIFNVAPISLFLSSGLSSPNARMLLKMDNPLWVLFPVFFITINALIIWFFNIWLVFRAKQIGMAPSRRYALSFMFTLSLIGLLQWVTSSIRPSFEDMGGLQFYPFIGWAANNAFILIMIDLILNKEKRVALEIEKANLEALNLQSKHEQLKQQIQPHFLFNALHTLKLLIGKDPKDAESYTIRLSSFLRASISDGFKEKASIRKEFEVFKDYMELQKVRFPGAIHYSHAISDSIMRQGYLPTFTLQTLGENAIKHTEFSVEDPLIIDIQENEGIISFANNYAPKRTVPISVGIGLTNLSERFKILSGENIEVSLEQEVFMVKLKAIFHESNDY